MIKPNITKKTVLDAIKERDAERKAKRNALKDKAKDWQQLSGKDKDDLLREVVEQVLGVERSSQ